MDLEEALCELMSEFIGDIPAMTDKKQKEDTVAKVMNVLRTLTDRKMAARVAAKLIRDVNTNQEDPIIASCTAFLEKRALREPDEEETSVEQERSETKEKEHGETSSH